MFNVKSMFTFSLHLFTLLFFYRKWARARFELQSQVTYFLFFFCQFFTTFYWTGDYDRQFLWKPYYIKLYIFLFFFYFSTFMIMGWVGHKNLYIKNLTYHSSTKALNRAQDIVQTFFAKKLSFEFKDVLNDLWYDTQLNYDKPYKNKFAIFMILSSFIFIFLFLYFWYWYVYYFFYSHRTPTAYIVMCFEKKILLYLKNCLKILFLYNLVISYVFNDLKPSWFFLIQTFETNEDFVCTLLENNGLSEILAAYNGVLWYWFVEETMLMKEFIFDNVGKWKYKKKNYQVLFKKENFDNNRYHLPKKWRSYKMSELDCIVSYNYYFKFWLRIQNLTKFVHYPSKVWFHGIYIRDRYGYKLWKIDTWRILDVHYTYTYSYQNYAYRESLKTVKKYKFK